MKNLLCIFLLLISYNHAFANSIAISGKIIDAESQKGIPNVHIYSAKLKAGTITNADGIFSLIVTKNDEIHISSIGYENQIINLSERSTKNLIIVLKLKTEVLDEIIINAKPIMVDIILEKVLKNFKKNHAVEPVYYQFYNRLINYTQDSILNSIEEYSGTITQNWMHSTKYNIEKGRIKYLTKDATQQLKNHRVTAMDKMYIDNIFKFREDYIKKKGKRRYVYKLVNKSNLLGRNCYIISFYTDKSTYYKKGELYIDMQDFAIARKILRASKNNKIINDITFKKENDKWYLKKTEDYHTGFESDNSITHRVTLYNYLDIKSSDLNFISLTSRDFSVDFSSNFNDEFWKNNNFIPMPNWVKKQL